MAVLTKAGSFTRPLPSYPYDSTPIGNTGSTGLQLAIDGSGNIYVVRQFTSDRLTKYNSAGTSLGFKELSDVSGVAVDASNNVYACFGNKIRKYNSGFGSHLWEVTLAGATTRQLAADGTHLYATTAGSGVLRFNLSDGSGLTILIALSTGSGNGQFAAAGPTGIAYDGIGSLYVLDPGNSRVQKFTMGGAFVLKWGSAGSGDGQFNDPQGIAVDPVTGLVFVTDRDNSRVQVFKPDGTFVGKFGVNGSGNGQFNVPLGIAFNGAGDVFVADQGGGSGRVQKFTLSLQTVVSGLGFEPKAIVWLLSNNLTPGTVRANADLGIGLTGRPTEAGSPLTRSLTIFSGNAAAAPAARISALNILGSIGATDWHSASVALDADGFTIEYDATGYDFEQERIAYLAFGDDCGARTFGNTSQTVFSSTDAPNTTKTQLFSDSFTPTGALLAAQCSTDESGSFGVAAAKTGGFDQWAQAYGGNITADPSQAHSALVNDAALCLIDQTGTIYFKAVVDSWNSSGITYRVTLNALPVGVTVRVFGVALNGSTMQAGVTAKATGAAPAAQVIATAERPEALLLAGGLTTNNNPASDVRAALGVSDGTSHATAATLVEDNVATADADTLLRTDNALVTPDGSPLNPTARAAATFNNTNFTLTWNPNNASGWRFGWFAPLRAVTELAGGATVQTGGLAAPLKFNHTGKLTGAATVQSGGATAKLRLDVKLSGNALVSTSGPAPLLSGQAELTGAAHVLVGRATEFAYLVESHILTGAAHVDVGHKNQPGWLGNALVGTHVLKGAALTTIGGDAATLNVGHQLFGNALITVTVGHSWPPQDHPLEGAALVVFDGTVPLLGRFPGELTGAALVEVLTPPAKLGSAFLLTGTALVSITTATLGLGGADLPEPKQLGPDDLAGTVNLFRNPSFERDELLGDVLALGGATSIIVGGSASLGWHGTASLEVTLDDVATDSGVILRSLRGLPYTGLSRAFLGQLRVRAETEIGEDLTARMRVHYTDSSDDAGEAIVWSPTPDDGWYTVYVPAALADGAKQVSHVDIEVKRPSAAVGQIVHIDGVQIELDRGHAHTPFALGTYGEPYHRWWGGAHASITIRDAIPLDSSAPAMRGEYRIEAFMYRANADNTKLEDLSAYVINAAVTADTERDVSWTLEAEMLPEGWKRLRPFVDWLAPVMRVTLPGGKVREGQLGHFMVVPSPREVDEWGERVQVDGRSAEASLQMQGGKGFVKVKENTRLIRAARVILDASHLGEGERGKARHNLPDDDERARRDMTWERKEPILNVVNDLLRKAGKRPLFATKTGVLTSVNRKKRRLKRLDPVRVWGANLPEDVSLDPWVTKVGTTDNEVVGTLSLTPDLGKWGDNKIVVVSVNPRKPRIRAVRYINDPDNPVNPKKRKRIKERKLEMDVGTNADAEELAEAIAEEIGTKLETVELSVLPDPTPELLRQVVYLAIYNAAREPVAVGRFAVHSVTYGWTADEALMTLNLGFVHSVDQLAGGDTSNTELAGGWNVAA